MIKILKVFKHKACADRWGSQILANKFIAVFPDISLKAPDYKSGETKDVDYVAGDLKRCCKGFVIPCCLPFPSYVAADLKSAANNFISAEKSLLLQ